MILIALACMLTFSTTAKAQYDFLRPVKGEIPGGYDFWVYTPTDYYYSLETTPVVMFLHGASLCSKDMNRSRRYGPLDHIYTHFPQLLPHNHRNHHVPYEYSFLPL